MLDGIRSAIRFISSLRPSSQQFSGPFVLDSLDACIGSPEDSPSRALLPKVHVVGLSGFSTLPVDGPAIPNHCHRVKTRRINGRKGLPPTTVTRSPRWIQCYIFGGTPLPNWGYTLNGITDVGLYRVVDLIIYYVLPSRRP